MVCKTLYRQKRRRRVWRIGRRKRPISTRPRYRNQEPVGRVLVVRLQVCDWGAESTNLFE